MDHAETPLGTVCLWLDGRPCANHDAWERIDASDYARLHPVDGNWRIAYWHEPDGGAHTLEYRLDPAVECEGGSASGERLEATEINDGKTVLVIAAEYDFEDHAHGHGKYEYDYTAATDDFGVIVELPVDAKAPWVVFGVSWVEGFDEESGVNPWLVGDPGGDRLKLAASVQKGHAVADAQMLPQACEWEVGSGIDLTNRRRRECADDGVPQELDNEATFVYLSCSRRVGRLFEGALGALVEPHAGAPRRGCGTPQQALDEHDWRVRTTAGWTRCGTGRTRAGSRRSRRRRKCLDAARA